MAARLWSSDQRGEECGGGTEQCRDESPGDLDELALRGGEFFAKGAVFVGEAVNGGCQHGELAGEGCELDGELAHMLDGRIERSESDGHRFERGGQVIQARIGPLFGHLCHFPTPCRYFSGPELRSGGSADERRGSPVGGRTWAAGRAAPLRIRAARRGYGERPSMRSSMRWRSLGLRVSSEMLWTFAVAAMARSTARVPRC